MMSCKLATHLLSQQLDRKLSRRETMSLNFHLMMCRGCTNFKENMAFLREACEFVAGEAAIEKI
ncbi:zf-HC2 domain-containing protein [Massilia putida]|uniref:zf-HC2 domain-containing protein n=1 Tax=Massilia putida TaxID=1141883 RepID=UPI000952E8E9|nr:zf-HC2 domain-containing protein [Massilia putida]